MILALNNKCNLTKDEFLMYNEKLKKLNFTKTTVIVFPTSLYLGMFSSNKILLGSQNVSMFASGPHTGEVSAKQLKSLNVEYSLVGHFERREEQHETNNSINKKIKNLISENITPILCIGEVSSEQEIVTEVLTKQLQESLKDLSKNDIEKIIIAYEPIWSIGTGIIPSCNKIKTIVNYLKSLYPNNKVLYGGSVNVDNVVKLTKENIVDGYLIGGLSLHLDKVQTLLNTIEK